MPTHSTAKNGRKIRLEEKRRVWDAIVEGRSDWLSVARANGISTTTAYDIRKHGLKTDKRSTTPRNPSKVTPEILDTIQEMVCESSDVTAFSIQERILSDYNVQLSTTTIYRYIDEIFSKNEEETNAKEACNTPVNKQKRKEFVEKLHQYENEGACIVYMDETEWNSHSLRNRGWEKKGKVPQRAVASDTEKNIQCQLAVNIAKGVVNSNVVLGTIDRESHIDFLKETIEIVADSSWYTNNYPTNTRIVIVMNNASAHNDSAICADVRNAICYEILYLAPYSPMLNPVENCFSMIKAHIKAYLSENMPTGSKQCPDENLTLVKDSILEGLQRLTLSNIINSHLRCARLHPAVLSLRDMIW